jgi:hypothetical protein
MVKIGLVLMGAAVVCTMLEGYEAAGLLVVATPLGTAEVSVAHLGQPACSKESTGPLLPIPWRKRPHPPSFKLAA